MVDPAMPCLCNMLLVLNTLCALNPTPLNIRNLRMVRNVSLTLKITDHAGKVITNRSGTTVVLHIQQFILII